MVTAGLWFCAQVFHGADSDIEWLQKDFGLYVVNMFDTHQAARLLNLGRHSLDHLLKLYCGVDSNKQYQLADWRIRSVCPPRGDEVPEGVRARLGLTRGLCSACSTVRVSS